MGSIKYLILFEIYCFQKYVRQAKRCFLLGTRLRGCDRYLVLQKSRLVDVLGLQPKLAAVSLEQIKADLSEWFQRFL